MGVTVDDPQWCELSNNKPKDYIDAIVANVDPKKCILVVVIIFNKDSKKPIKAHLDKMGVPSQFVTEDTIKRSSGKLGVYSNILKQMNAKVKLDVYRLKFTIPNMMVVGIDVVNMGRKSIIGFASSYSPYITQHYTEVTY
jgi:hypothetical protein